jgi:hypothetical protein
MAYSDVVLSKSPLLYWKLDEDPPGTGTAADASGNGRTGTYVGSPTSIRGLLSQGSTKAVLFGSGQYITSTYNPYAIDTSLTFECWVRRDSNTGADAMWGSDAAASMVIFRLPASADTVQLFPQNASRVDWLNSGVGVGTGSHIVLAWNGTTDAARLYINAQDKGQQTVGQDFAAAPGNFSVAMRATGNDIWNGALDEVAIYSGILSGASVLENYLAGTAAGLMSTLAPVPFMSNQRI